jgi:hypothetical protein
LSSTSNSNGVPHSSNFQVPVLLLLSLWIPDD